LLQITLCPRLYRPWRYNKRYKSGTGQRYRRRAVPRRNPRSGVAVITDPTLDETKTGKKPPDKHRLTKSSVAALEPPLLAPGGNPTPPRVVWDRDLAGFGVRVMTSGVKTYFLQRRTKTGRPIKLTIGRADRVTADRARERARELAAAIDLGRDPATELRDRRHAERSRVKEPTVRHLADRYLAEYAERRKRPASVAGDRSLLHKHVLPELGRLKVAAVTSSHIEKLHAAITNGGASYAANRCLALLSKMFALAERWQLRAGNPVRGVQRNPEEPRTRYLTPAELHRLAFALHRRGDLAAKCLEFLLLTGARRNEMLTARWRDFELDQRACAWTKPSAHTKQRRVHRVPLSPAALRILTDLPRGEDADRVFPLADHQLRVAWRQVCEEAAIVGARVHDLRHAHASILASAGLSLPIIGALLGHTQASTTSRYTHLLDDPLRVAAARVAELYEAMRRGNSAEIVPLKANA
jgi:integrase